MNIIGTNDGPTNGTNHRVHRQHVLLAKQHRIRHVLQRYEKKSVTRRQRNNVVVDVGRRSSETRRRMCHLDDFRAERHGAPRRCVGTKGDRSGERRSTHRNSNARVRHVDTCIYSTHTSATCRYRATNHSTNNNDIRGWQEGSSELRRDRTILAAAARAI